MARINDIKVKTTFENRSKPGFRTTEFWLSLAAIVLVAVQGSGLLDSPTEPALNLVNAIISALIAGLAAIGYSASRAAVKRAELAVLPIAVAQESHQAEAARGGGLLQIIRALAEVLRNPEVMGVLLSLLKMLSDKPADQRQALLADLAGSNLVEVRTLARLLECLLGGTGENLERIATLAARQAGLSDAEVNNLVQQLREVRE